MSKNKNVKKLNELSEEKNTFKKIWSLIREHPFVSSLFGIFIFFIGLIVSTIIKNESIIYVSLVLFILLIWSITVLVAKNFGKFFYKILIYFLLLCVTVLSIYYAKPIANEYSELNNESIINSSIQESKKLDTISINGQKMPLYDTMIYIKPSGELIVQDLRSAKNKKPENLYDLFNYDFAKDIDYGTFDTLFLIDTIGDKSYQRFKYYGICLIDYKSKTLFLSYYIPKYDSTFFICGFLSQNSMNYISEVKTKYKQEMINTKTGQNLGQLENFVFNQHVYIYNEQHLFKNEVDFLTSMFKKQGVNVEFRDIFYANRRLNENK